MYKLAPSILAANFSILGQEIKSIENAGAHYVHIDVMDGNFVSNISLGIPIIKSIRDVTDMTFDVHLMIVDPNRYVKDFVNAGADIINVHVEACSDVLETLTIIKGFNKRAAIAVKPSTNIESIFPYLEYLDMVLIMSVEPGFCGQSFKTEILKKTEKLANYIIKNNIILDIEMDGGINLENVRDVINAGTNVVVVGSSVFKTNDVIGSVRKFYNIFKEINKGETC